MIDFDDIDTVPSSITSLLYKKRDLIREELLLETKKSLAGHQWKGGTVTTAIYKESFDKITELLYNEKIIGFHCTKLIKPNEIFTTCLKKLNPREYENWMKQFLKEKLPNKKTIAKIDKYFAEYNGNGEYEHRENMIWFVINKSLIYDSGCKDFFKYFGGEVMRRVAYPIKDIVYPILIQSGIPTVVAFEFKFNELPNDQQHNLVKSFIESKVFEKSHKYYRNMEVEGYIKRDVKPEEIVQVFQDIDVEKLKQTVINAV